MNLTRLQQKIILCFGALALSQFIVGCGNGFQVDQRLIVEGQNVHTGAVNKDHKPYTTFSAVTSFEKLKSQVPDSPEAKAFALSIEKAHINSVDSDGFSPENSVEVRIHWLNVKDPQILRGALARNNEGVFGTKLTTKSGLQKDIYLEATCASANCDVVQSLVRNTQDDQIVGGIMFHNEDRVLRTIESPDIDPTKMSTRARAFYNNHKQGTPVKVRASVIINGASQYEVTENSNNDRQTLLKGELVSPEGDKINLSETGAALNGIGHTDLVGNDEENGELVYLLEDSLEETIHSANPIGTTQTSPDIQSFPQAQPEPSARPRAKLAFIIEQKPQAQAQAQSQPQSPTPVPARAVPTPQRPVTPPAPVRATPTPPQASQTPPTSQRAPEVSVGRNQAVCSIARPTQNSASVDKTIRSLIKDCANTDTKLYGGETKGQFFAKFRQLFLSDRFFELSNTLSIHRNVETKSRFQEGTDEWGFQLMIESMKQANMASVLAAAMTVVETGFVNWRRGTSGECGVMQFMPATARDRGLTRIFGPIQYNGQRACSPQDDRRNYQKAMPAFAVHLQLLNRYFPENALMITASYNGGQGTALRSQDRVEANVRRDRQLRSLSPEEVSLMSNDFFWHKAKGSFSRGAIDHTGKVAAVAQMLLNTQVYDTKIQEYPSMKAQ